MLWNRILGVTHSEAFVLNHYTTEHCFPKNRFSELFSHVSVTVALVLYFCFQNCIPGKPNPSNTERYVAAFFTHFVFG